MSKKTFYITTPIYYPSGNLHIGHVYTTTLAWTIKNFKILSGYDAKFLTGADEHGQKIELKAKEIKKSTQKYVDEMTIKFKELWNKLDIQYDYYSRTTNKNHKESVKKIFSKLLENGTIYKGKYKGLYSIQDEEFFTITQALKKKDKFYHPTSGHELFEVEEESYFFKMAEHQIELENYFKENPQFVIPNKIVKELKNNFLDKGIEDLSVTRTSFDWGIKINEESNHVIYVWMDALTNYITALGYGTNNEKDFEKYWKNGDEIVHVVGKEITRFHCIYWPIILIALGIKQPSTIVSHGWIITSEGKMSKSKNNVVDPLGLIKEFGPEPVKYFFASQINMGQDGVFDRNILKSVINTDLANNFGNLLSRTVAMTKQNFDVPVKYSHPKSDLDIELYNKIESTLNEYKKEFNNYNPNKAFNSVIKLSKFLNGYIEKTEPWKLKENREKLEIILNNLLNGIYAVTTMLSVVIPKKASEALKSIGFDSPSLELIKKWDKFDEIIVEKISPIFERIK